MYNIRVFVSRISNIYIVTCHDKYGIFMAPSVKNSLLIIIMIVMIIIIIILLPSDRSRNPNFLIHAFQHLWITSVSCVV